MSQPYHYIIAPATIYLAPVGESFPDVDTTPGGNWAKLGTGGDLDLSEDGVTVTSTQSLNQFFGLGSTAPRKVKRAQEGLTIEGSLQDMTLEEFTKLLDEKSVSTGTTSGGTSTKEINLQQGRAVNEYALLIRTDSPYGDGKTRQYQIPRVYQASDVAPAYTKDGVAMGSFNFTALRDEDASTEEEVFGQIVDES
jgi:hypothetical protein